METCRRKDLNDRYFVLEIFECPKEIILFAAKLGSGTVTIENFSNHGRQRAGFQFRVELQDRSVTPLLQRFDVDFAITRDEFSKLIDLWDEQGCYAVLHEVAPLKLRASDLPEHRRYPVLENFGWTIEIAVPGASSDGWAQIASPNRQVIEMIEEELRDLRNSD